MSVFKCVDLPEYRDNNKHIIANIFKQTRLYIRSFMTLDDDEVMDNDMDAMDDIDRVINDYRGIAFSIEDGYVLGDQSDIKYLMYGYITSFIEVNRSSENFPISQVVDVNCGKYPLHQYLFTEINENIEWTGINDDISTIATNIGYQCYVSNEYPYVNLGNEEGLTLGVFIGGEGYPSIYDNTSIFDFKNHIDQFSKDFDMIVFRAPTISGQDDFNASKLSEYFEFVKITNSFICESEKYPDACMTKLVFAVNKKHTGLNFDFPEIYEQEG